MNEYQAKLRSLGFPRRIGTSQRKEVTDERDGTVGGYQTEHWDDSVDADIHLKTVHVRGNLSMTDFEEVKGGRPERA